MNGIPKNPALISQALKKKIESMRNKLQKNENTNSDILPLINALEQQIDLNLIFTEILTKYNYALRALQEDMETNSQKYTPQELSRLVDLLGKFASEVRSPAQPVRQTQPANLVQPHYPQYPQYPRTY